MATPTLPHPNMDFTPLDILTAAEMDKMVANDQYLRNFCDGLAKGTNIENGVIQAHKLAPGVGNYSNSEVNTGFIWTDRKTIYKKTLSIGGGLQAPLRRVPHQIAKLDKCIKCEAFSIAGGTYRSFPYVNTSLQNLGYVMVEIDRNNVNIYSAINRNDWHVFVTIYYTKS